MALTDTMTEQSSQYHLHCILYDVSGIMRRTRIMFGQLMIYENCVCSPDNCPRPGSCGPLGILPSPERPATSAHGGPTTSPQTCNPAIVIITFFLSLPSHLTNFREAIAQQSIFWFTSFSDLRFTMCLHLPSSPSTPATAPGGSWTVLKS